jgi:ppGpp synthetase/RelA/SpoT-type nucleotidyltranferase
LGAIAMANRKKVNKAVKWYQKERSKYINLKAEIEKILKEALNENEIIFHSIESRVKSVNSFREKALREKYDDPVTEITDLTGMLEIADREFNTLSEEVEKFRQNKNN